MECPAATAATINSIANLVTAASALLAALIAIWVQITVRKGQKLLDQNQVLSDENQRIANAGAKPIPLDEKGNWNRYWIAKDKGLSVEDARDSI